METPNPHFQRDLRAKIISVCVQYVYIYIELKLLSTVFIYSIFVIH